MRRILPISVLFAVVIGLSITYVIIQAQRPAIWQIKLDNYIKYQNDILIKDPRLSGTVTVVAVTAARHPEHFHQIDDKKLVSGNHYWLLENDAILSSAPDEVMCVLLEKRSQTSVNKETNITYQPLFLAYFSHTLEPDWLIYQGDNSATIGCELSWSR